MASSLVKPVATSQEEEEVKKIARTGLLTYQVSQSISIIYIDSKLQNTA